MQPTDKRIQAAGAGPGKRAGCGDRDGVTPPLDALLAGLRLALGTGDRGADRAALAATADWRGMVRLARHHRVAPLLLAGLGSGAAGLAGADAVARLRRRRGRSLVRSAGQLDALRHAARTLDGAGIPCIVLKGLPLARRLYPDLGSREAIDIDVLVPPGDFDGAERVLRDRGWERRKPDFRQTPARRRWHDRVVKDHVLVRPNPGGAGPAPVLELHRRLANNPFLLDLPFARLDESGVTVEVGGYPFRTPGDEDQLLYLASHGLEHGWHRLKWLCDVALLLRSMDEDGLARAMARGRAAKLGCALVPAFRLVAEALHVPVPAAAAALGSGGARASLVARFARREWHGEPPGAWPRIAREAQVRALRIVLKDDPRFRRHEIATLAFAPHDFGRVEVPDGLFFLYPVLRPFVLLGKRLRARPGGPRGGASGRPRPDPAPSPSAPAAVSAKNVLVTGAGGFLGSHLAARLLAGGHRVRCVDRKPLDEWHRVHPEAENLVADLREAGSCLDACRGIDECYQLAADMGGMGFIENNKARCMLSVLVNTHMLMAARERGLESFFFSSSACVYNEEKQRSPDVTPLREEDAYPAMPEDGYGWEKLFSERMCRHFREPDLADAMLPLDDVDWRLDLCGPVAADAAGVFARLRRDPRVRYLGQLLAPELAARMTAADVLVLPALAEGSARVVFEGLAAGCYVVTTPNAGSIVADGVHGRLVAPGRPEAIARALRDAAGDRPRVARIGARNAALVRRCYRQSHYGERLFALYRRLLDEPDAHPGSKGSGSDEAHGGGRNERRAGRNNHRRRPGRPSR